ncbi:MAG TPA: metallophosphoesterase family protein [Candidatus Binatia bacterium]|nr:metallophosphoesterase family protein [Candidatus Binatia bacterium]
MAGRLFAVGDLHGCARELERLLAALRPTAGDTIAFVGDYVDRGPDSRSVIELLLDLEGRSRLTTVFLKGNHEDMCLGYLGLGGHWGESWMMNGAGATLQSYGLDPHAPAAEARGALPAAHVAFLQRLLPYRADDDWLLVHAGIRPGRPLAAQDEEDLLWIRDEFILEPHELPQTVVFGHTPFRAPLVDLPYKIGIDTGCVYGGTLTALELRERTVFQLRRGERAVRSHSLAPVPRRA